MGAMAVARLAAGALLALAIGLAALAAAGLPVRPRWARLGLGLALGVEVLVVLGLPLALLGAPAGPGAIVALGLAVALALAGLAVRRGARPEEVSPAAEERTPLATAGAVVLAAAVALALAKLAAVPLWSWDHVAVWGAKSRHLIAGGRLDLSFMSGPGFEVTAHYPLGLPAAWRVVALGAPPGELEVDLVHALSVLALVGLARDGCRRLGSPAPLAAALAALLAVSPLVWDTVAVGLAELPLALWAAAGLVAALAARGEPSAAAAPAGLLLGFLPWLKEEGLVLSLLTAGAAAFLLARRGDDRRGRRLLAFAAPWLAAVVAARAIAAVWLPAQLTFLGGDWQRRALARLADPWPILAALARELADPGWLGLWPLFAGALVVAALRRRAAALALGGVVAAALAVYAAVYFVTAYDPVTHLLPSFARVTAALVPLALLAIAAAAAPADPV